MLLHEIGDNHVRNPVWPIKADRPECELSRQPCMQKQVLKNTFR